MYANRKNIELIQALKLAYAGRVCQTNSRRNGNFIKAVRLYKTPADAGHPARAEATFTTAAEIKNYLGR